jgi:ABC-type cobalamin/Fe3+-siderophores transport system ATPase subunit
MNDLQPLLRAEQLCFAYPDSPPLLDNVSLSAGAHRLLAIAGPNGAGKSTLLKILAGVRQPRAGRVLLEGRDLHKLNATQRAQRVAYLPQHPPTPEGLTAWELVLLGRHPYRGLRLFESAQDFAIARASLARTQTEAFADRPIATLSGGELQRVHLAACLAQEPDVLLLDEPTSDLDLAHQLRMFELLQTLAKNAELAVVVVTHDLNWALRFADDVLLLHDGAVVAHGSPADVLHAEILSKVYGVRFEVIEAPDGKRPYLVAQELVIAQDEAP